MCYAQLRGKIVERYGSIERFARNFGATPTTVGKKLSGKSDWTQSEIIKAVTLLDIPAENIPTYFFS